MLVARAEAKGQRVVGRRLENTRLAYPYTNGPRSTAVWCEAEPDPR